LIARIGSLGSRRWLQGIIKCELVEIRFIDEADHGFHQLILALVVGVGLHRGDEILRIETD